MGYRVEYPTSKKMRKQERDSRAAVLTCLFFLLFLLAVSSIWPEGKSLLQDLAFTGDAAVTAAALEEVASDLQEGIPFARAFREFCVYVMGESAVAAH